MRNVIVFIAEVVVIAFVIYTIVAVLYSLS